MTLVFYRGRPSGARGLSLSVPPLGVAVRSLLALWETGGRLPVFQGAVGAAGVQAGVGGVPLGDFEGPSMAAAGPAASIGLFEAVPWPWWCTGRWLLMPGLASRLAATASDVSGSSRLR